MNYRTLGGTGLRVSEIGFGTWGLGGDTGVLYFTAGIEDEEHGLFGSIRPQQP